MTWRVRPLSNALSIWSLVLPQWGQPLSTSWDSGTRSHPVFVPAEMCVRLPSRWLGYLMGALPNATCVGFTGTPIDKTVYGRGTFITFGKEGPPHGYFDKYGIAESIEDGTAVPLHYALAPNELRVDRETLEREFLDLAEAQGVSDIVQPLPVAHLHGHTPRIVPPSIYTQDAGFLKIAFPPLCPSLGGACSPPFRTHVSISSRWNRHSVPVYPVAVSPRCPPPPSGLPWRRTTSISG